MIQKQLRTKKNESTTNFNKLNQIIIQDSNKVKF